MKYAWLVGYVGFLLTAPYTVRAQQPDHPIITEIYNNPPGENDGPVGRDPVNLHQEYIEIYLPTAAALDPLLNKDALSLTFYEIEGDTSSSGYALVNYRFDLPVFDIDPSNGTTALPRPPSGVVVLGWVDYVGDPPTDLAGTPSTRVAMINGGITDAGGDYTFIAINGNQFSGTTNFPTLLAESLINMPSEASSGAIQNGSAAYLLVNRDDPGYVELYDDNDPAHVPPISNADPALATGTVLSTTALLDGVAGNDDDAFAVEDQPYPFGDDVDLSDVLPAGGPFSNLIAQIWEEQLGPIQPGPGTGYARVYPDLPKTTETGAADDPVADAINAYRQIRTEGPFIPTPGYAAFTNSPPRLAVLQEEAVEVIALTTGNPAILAANIGGDYPIDIAVTQGNSDDPVIAVYSPGIPSNGVGGQAYGFPTVAVSGAVTVPDGSTTSGTVTLTAGNSNGGDPPVVDGVQVTALAATVLNPTTGTLPNGQPFQATIFAAVEPVVASPSVANEFLQTDLGAFLMAQPDVTILETEGHGEALIDPLTDINNPDIVGSWIKEMPVDGEECLVWLNPPGPPGTDDFATTVVSSAEVQSGSDAYDTSIAICPQDPFPTVIRAIHLNVPDTLTFGGSFSTSVPVSFADATGRVGIVRSGLSNVTTTRTFELALIDTQVQFNGGLETGATDDFGMVIEVAETEPGAPVVSGEFVAISMTGGFALADIDSLDADASVTVANIIYLDLDNLHDELGIRTIESIYIVDAGDTSEADFIEAFSLNFPVGCTDSTQCDDGNVCTEDICNMVSMACEHQPLNGPADQDGLFCNGIDQCQAGVFVPGTPIDCSDGNICTDDSCHEAGDTCVNANNTNACDDNNLCTENDTCFGGVCSGDPIPGCDSCLVDADCDDGTDCTINTCNQALEICEFTPDDGACPDDGVFCNGPEICLGVDGAPGTGCASAGPPCDECTEEQGCPCDTPLAVAHGSRYLAITPSPGAEPVGLLVTTCSGALPQYVGYLPGQAALASIDLTNDGSFDGSVAGLVEDPAEALYLAPAEWGQTIFVTGLKLLPGQSFDVQADCGSPGAPNLTAPATVMTDDFGDVNSDQTANFGDILLAVQAFQQNFIEGNSKLRSDMAECFPNQLNNFSDVLYAVAAFQQDTMENFCPASFVCP